MLVREFLKYNFDKNTFKDGKEKREFNINSFKYLVTNDVLNLKYKIKMRRILLYRTLSNEKIYIYFPGKECDRKDDKTRPWDFFPVLFNSKNERMEDLSFKDIWNDIMGINIKKNNSLSLISALFYRNSNMIDSKKVKENYIYEDLDENGIVVDKGEILFEWYKLDFSKKFIEKLSEEIIFFRKGYSVEAYIYYNDLLAQNEDCKYYYREAILKNKKWNGKLGRFNNLSTHINVIGYKNEKLTFTEIIDKFQRGRGVAPEISKKKISEFTDWIIVENK